MPSRAFLTAVLAVVFRLRAGQFAPAVIAGPLPLPGVAGLRVGVRGARSCAPASPSLVSGTGPHRLGLLAPRRCAAPVRPCVSWVGGRRVPVRSPACLRRARLCRAAFAPARPGCAAPPGQLIGHCIHERYGLVIVIKQAGNAVYIPGLAVLRDRIHLARAVRRHVRGHTQGPRGSLNVCPNRLTRPVARFIMRMGKNIRRACNGP